MGRIFVVTFISISIACTDGSTVPADSGPSNERRDTSSVPFAVPACIATAADSTFGGGNASVTITGADCARTFEVRSNAPMRDSNVSNPRRITEASSSLQSGNAWLDALYALAQSESREASVASISDGAFDNGKPWTCPSGGCYETGKLWAYVWTRDTSYATHLGLASIDPSRASNSLLFKLSTRRDGSDEEIAQDTGSGGSYPVSTDRIVWALGARAVAGELVGAEHSAFVRRAHSAIRNTILHDRVAIFDAKVGLYRGETSFLDWREQTYPAETKDDVVSIAESFALSTNTLHLAALETAAAFAAELGETQSQSELFAWATTLREAIRTRFWIKDDGFFGAWIPSALDTAPVRRVDVLGNSLAILHGVATEEQARSILRNVVHVGFHVPVVWPEEAGQSVYHNRAMWPFVTAYFARAARGKNASVVTNSVASLVMTTSEALSHMENYDVFNGRTRAGDGTGPVVNSPRQLWSVAGFLSLVEHTLFGFERTALGITIAPFIPGEVRRGWLPKASRIALNRVSYQGKWITIALRFPTALEGDAFALSELWLNGHKKSSTELPTEQLASENLIEVVLQPIATDSTVRSVAASDALAVFALDPIRIAQATTNGTSVSLKVEPTQGLLEAFTKDSTLSWSIYRDGELVASSLATSSVTYVDSVHAAGCYSVEATRTATNATSHRSPAMCVSARSVMRISANTFSNVGGSASTNYGRFHFQEWGDPGHRLDVSNWVPPASGSYALSLSYGNGAGPINTGITCALKWVHVTDDTTGSEVRVLVVMPQVGNWSTWRTSTRARVDLVASHRYRMTIEGDSASTNMSNFAHFARYTGGEGGSSGAFERANVEAIVLEPWE